MSEPLRLPDRPNAPGDPVPPLIPIPAAEAPARDSRVEVYLDQVFGPLAGLIPSARRQELRDEMSAHLEALIEAHQELGSEPDVAIQSALEQCGDPARLAREWAREWRRPTGPRAAGQEVFGNLFPAHVRRRAEARFPVTAAPVPGGIDERRLSFEQLLDALEVAVGFADEFLDHLGG